MQKSSTVRKRNALFFQLNQTTDGHQAICFPYLGGYANAFLQLAHHLDGSVEVWAANPPGHGGSAAELVDDIDTLIDRYIETVVPIMRPGCIFFGHSMGGTIAYYLTRRLLEGSEGAILPKAVLISACGAPSCMRETYYSRLADNKLVELMNSYGAMPEEVLKETEFLKMLMPIFRADYRVLESAAQKEPAQLDVPTYLLWGQCDPVVPINEMLRWRRYLASKPIIWPMKDAGHMFIHTQVEQVAKYVELGCVG